MLDVECFVAIIAAAGAGRGPGAAATDRAGRPRAERTAWRGEL